MTKILLRESLSAEDSRAFQASKMMISLPRRSPFQETAAEHLVKQYFKKLKKLSF